MMYRYCYLRTARDKIRVTRFEHDLTHPFDVLTRDIFKSDRLIYIIVQR